MLKPTLRHIEILADEALDASTLAQIAVTRANQIRTNESRLSAQDRVAKAAEAWRNVLTAWEETPLT